MTKKEKTENSEKDIRKEFHKKYLKSSEFEYVRQSVFKRDNYKCVLCGRKENLVCHHTTYLHLGEHNEDEINDCVTLCNLDHINHHRAKYNLRWYAIDHPRNNKEENKDNNNKDKDRDEDKE